jgi:5-oxoprolinase (ATP-hydrolysing)
VNIKERLDFSCALFDAEGSLIANAPHMPVHLGSMSESIRTVIARNPEMRSGDVYVLNDPYHGGTHLPDVTVVTPVYIDAGDAHPGFFVASRGHHADIGGATPGSMPPFSTSIAEEGVLIDNFKLIEHGMLREGALRDLLSTGLHPSRNPDQNLADLRAQIAANEKGALELKATVAQHGRDTVLAYMRHHGAQGRRVHAAAGQWVADPGKRAGRRAAAQCPHRLQRHQPAAVEQFQCTAGDHHGRRLVRVSHPGG